MPGHPRRRHRSPRVGGCRGSEAILLVAFPWVGAAVLAAEVATGLLPPFTVDFFETQWAGNTILPGGGSNADHGLDKIIADAATEHAHNTVPRELVDGIIDDFQGTGALSGHHGHGYCALDPWIRTATVATNVQSPYVPVFGPIVHNLTLGTLHPNAAGHADYAAHIFEHLASLLPTPPPGGGSASPTPRRRHELDGQHRRQPGRHDNGQFHARRRRLADRLRARG